MTEPYLCETPVIVFKSFLWVLSDRQRTLSLAECFAISCLPNRILEPKLEKRTDGFNIKFFLILLLSFAYRLLPFPHHHCNGTWYLALCRFYDDFSRNCSLLSFCPYGKKYGDLTVSSLQPIHLSLALPALSLLQ